MARSRDEKPTIYECIQGFAPATGPDRVQRRWVKGDTVTDDHLILKTHSQFFEPIIDRMVRNRPVEQATAAPGEVRTVHIPVQIRSDITTQEETEDAQV